MHLIASNLTMAGTFVPEWSKETDRAWIARTNAYKIHEELYTRAYILYENTRMVARALSSQAYKEN